MFQQQDYRDNPINWSLTLGRWFGIRVRIHLLFILWTLLELVRGLTAADGLFQAKVVIIVTLFVVVLLHEFGHCFGARGVGGDADDILMWPLGGLAAVQVPMTPRAQFLTTAAGPAVNVLCCMLCLAVLLLSGHLAAVSFNPFAPFGVSSGSVRDWAAVEWVAIFWGINYWLLLFNLLPMFPMDGGRLLQSVIWRYRNYTTATIVATFIGMTAAIGLGLFGMLSQELLLVCIAVFGYMTCMQHRQMLRAGMMESEADWGYESGRGPGSEESAASRQPSWWARRRAARASQKAAGDRRRQQALDARLDAILDKVHRYGITGLNAREKKLLTRETDRRKQI